MESNTRWCGTGSEVPASADGFSVATWTDVMGAAGKGERRGPHQVGEGPFGEVTTGVFLSACSTAAQDAGGADAT